MEVTSFRDLSARKLIIFLACWWLDEERFRLLVLCSVITSGVTASRLMRRSRNCQRQRVWPCWLMPRKQCIITTVDTKKKTFSGLQIN